MIDEKWIDRRDEITLKIDPNQFLQKAGECVNAKDLNFLKYFLAKKQEMETILI